MRLCEKPAWRDTRDIHDAASVILEGYKCGGKRGGKEEVKRRGLVE